MRSASWTAAGGHWASGEAFPYTLGIAHKRNPMTSVLVRVHSRDDQTWFVHQQYFDTSFIWPMRIEIYSRTICKRAEIVETNKLMARIVYIYIYISGFEKSRAFLVVLGQPDLWNWLSSAKSYLPSEKSIALSY